MLVEQAADFAQVGRCRALGRKRLQHQLLDGSAEGALEQVAQELALSGLLTGHRLVNMGARACASRSTRPLPVMICNILRIVV